MSKKPPRPGVRFSPGRRKADKYAANAIHFLKLLVTIVAAISTAYLAVIGAYMVGYSQWQDMKQQMKRDSAPPPIQTVPPKVIT